MTNEEVRAKIQHLRLLSALHFEDCLAVNYTHIPLFSVCFETALSTNTLPDAVEHVTGVLLLVVLIMV